jgi:hypothetical protein
MVLWAEDYRDDVMRILQMFREELVHREQRAVLQCDEVREKM